MAALPPPPPATITLFPPTLSLSLLGPESLTTTRLPKSDLSFLLASHPQLYQTGRFHQLPPVIGTTTLDRSRDAQKLLKTAMLLEIVLQETLTAETAAVGLSSDRPVLAIPVTDPAVVTRNKICNPL